MKMRNSLVLVRVLEKKEEQVGAITVPQSAEGLFTEGEVLDVGPGSVSAEGGRSETFDLKPGQRVFLKARELRPGPDGRSGLTRLAGIEYVRNGELLHIFEQSSVVAIITEPGEAPPSKPQVDPRQRGKLLTSNGGSTSDN